MNKSNYIWYSLLSIISGFSICFCYYPVCHYWLWGVIVFGVIFINKTEITIRINNIVKEWLLIFCIWFIGALYSMDPVRGIKYCIAYFLAFIISLYFLKYSSLKFVKALYGFSLIHVLATIIREIAPNFIGSLCSVILPAKLLNSQNLIMHGGHWVGNIGITTQTGWNAFFITINLLISLTFIFCYDFHHKKKYFYYISSVLSLVSLLLTNKRGYLIAVLVTIVFSFLIKYLTDITKKKLFILIIWFCLFCSLMFCGFYFSNTFKVFGKIKSLNNMDMNSISAGRLVIYTRMVSLLLPENKFIFGFGTGSTNSMLGIDGHNIYLQLIFENGLIFSGVFFYVFIKNWFISLKKNILLNKLQLYDYRGNDIIVCLSFLYQTVFLCLGFLSNPLYDTPMFLLYTLLLFCGNSKCGNPKLS